MPSNWSKPSWHAHSYSIIPTPGDAAVEILTDIITNGDAQGSETTNLFLLMWEELMLLAILLME